MVENLFGGIQKLLKPRPKQQFILTIGDAGAILVYMNGKNRLESRLFAPSPDAPEVDNFRRLFARNNKAPIYVLLDVMDQSYTQQSLPGVSKFNIGGLISTRLERDFPQDNLKGYLLQGRSDTGRKDWNVMFIATPEGAPLSQWLDILKPLPNKVEAISLLPVETENFAKHLSNFIPRSSIESTAQPHWQLIITHNKVSGFRQTVLKDGDIIFTRLIAPSQEVLPDILAGAIEQEAQNTIEYLRRLSFEEHHALEVLVIAAPDITQRLEDSKLHANRILCYSPFEVANMIGVKNVASHEDKFADVVLSAVFSQTPPRLELFTSEGQESRSASNISQAAGLATAVIVIALLSLSINAGWSIFSTLRDVQFAKNEVAAVRSAWKEAQTSEEYSIEDAEKISDIITLYKKISGRSHSPLSIISGFGAVKGGDVLVKSIDWKTSDAITGEGVIKRRPRGGKQNITVSTTFSIEFRNRGGSIDGLFASFDRFIARLNKQFSDYEVKYSQLPQRITFGKRNELVPVQLEIIGPKSAKK